MLGLEPSPCPWWKVTGHAQAQARAVGSQRVGHRRSVLWLWTALTTRPPLGASSSLLPLIHPRGKWVVWLTTSETELL